jgi:type VI secretion system protein VasD
MFPVRRVARSWAAWSTLGLALLLVSGCSATRYVATPVEKMTLQAAPTVNPDANGRASPIEVRVYELASRTTFDALDFDSAWSNAEVVLGDQLLSQQMYVLLPRQTQVHRVELAPQAAFIAVVAAYRDIDGARWKLIYPVRPHWFNRHRILLDANAVALASGRQGQTDAQQ